jgi:hypothetical protein
MTTGVMPMPPAGQPDYSKCRYLYGLSISALMQNLAGSGIAMGYPLVFASMAAYAHYCRRAMTGFSKQRTA